MTGYLYLLIQPSILKLNSYLFKKTKEIVYFLDSIIIHNYY